MQEDGGGDDNKCKQAARVCAHAPQESVCATVVLVVLPRAHSSASLLIYFQGHYFSLSSPFSRTIIEKN